MRSESDITSQMINSTGNFKKILNLCIFYFQREVKKVSDHWRWIFRARHWSLFSSDGAEFRNYRKGKKLF